MKHTEHPELTQARQNHNRSLENIAEIDRRLAELTTKHNAAKAEHTAAIATIERAATQKEQAIRGFINGPAKDSSELRQVFVDTAKAEATRDASAALMEATMGEITRLQDNLSSAYRDRTDTEKELRRATARDACRRLLIGPGAPLVREAIDAADDARIDLAQTLRQLSREVAV